MGKTGRDVGFSTQRSKARATNSDTPTLGHTDLTRFQAQAGAQLAEYRLKQFQTARKCRQGFPV